MRQFRRLRIYFFFLIVFLSQMYSQDFLRVMSFNIRYDNPNDGKNIWDNRKDQMIEMLNCYQPDFIGLQEALINQLSYITNGLQNYSYIGVGREDGKEKGEFSPILFDTSKFELIRQKTFWLSETDDIVSVGWDAALERICTYGLFKERRTEELFHVFNTHFDHMGDTARLMSAKLIMKKIDKFTNDSSKIILMGDFNCELDSEPISIIKNELDYGADVSLKRLYGPDGTFNGFNESIIITERIDFIFIKNLQVLTYRHIDDRTKNNNFISDHLPVIVEVKFE
ncbi:MAG: endonuclease/exonuclease/phosphatase family protein [Ignavibacteriales bacterium]|nr:endonuclease/exonuclease/phosphatase family protein [Ignavibacteriales bacterium]